jgi:hypothetical protein
LSIDITGAAGPGERRRFRRDDRVSVRTSRGTIEEGTVRAVTGPDATVYYTDRGTTAQVSIDRLTLVEPADRGRPPAPSGGAAGGPRGPR